MTNKQKNHFADAKSVLRAALDSESETVTLTRDQIVELYKSRPQMRPLRRVFATFGPEYLRFLRPAVQSEYRGHTLPGGSGGVTVLPCKDGGVTLFATDGKIALIARDKEGSCSSDGLRMSVPNEAFDACVPPDPFRLTWEGCFQDLEDSIPDFALPEVVCAYGACLLVMPKGQPKGCDEEDGGALFSCSLSYSYDWSDQEYTLSEPYHWQKSVDFWLNSENSTGEQTKTIDISLGNVTIPAISEATSIFPNSVWGFRRLPGNALLLLPHDRDDLAIYVAMADGSDEKPLPSWMMGGAA